MTANKIREELAPYIDVDIMFASARSLRGVDYLWSKIWQSVTETPTGRRHKDIGRRELARLQQMGPEAVERAKGHVPLSELLNIPDIARPQEELKDFDSEREWAEDADELKKEKRQKFFDDKWGEELNESESETSSEDLRDISLEEGEEGEEDGMIYGEDGDEQGEWTDDADLEEQWEAYSEDDGEDAGAMSEDFGGDGNYPSASSRVTSLPDDKARL
eukprot:TRINITY_DN23561_c1_g1_i1.p1 TRINITY_DN23561_c1_g1~~TRINITY_DN23561_c1_g1_i1.p1  ORF type:complete len:218 (-),score=70.41 TRINITY_DN23561_c1_g1_i1:152-805(-)